MKALLIFLLGFALRAVIIATRPVIWGGDSVIRLYDRFTLAKAHELPALQTLIAGVSLVSMDAALVRYLMAIIGGVAGVGFYWLIRDLFGERWALPAALLFAAHPYILAVSTEPYQEILMLAGLLFAFHYFFGERWLLASLCLAIACLTRYEAWAACPVLAAAYFLRKDRSAAGAVKAAVLFGWAPVAWILWHHGLTQAGSFVLDHSISFWRVQRYAYLAWITVKFSQATVLVLAGAGVWRLYRDRSLLDWRMRALIAFVALLLIAILFSAHGVMPDPERYVTAREAHVPMFFVLVLAAAGLAQWPRWASTLAAASVVLGLAMAFWYVHTEMVDPSVRLDYQVAQLLDRSLGDSGRALLLTKPLTHDLIDSYLAKVRETGTEADVREAEREIQQAALAPPEFERVVVQSRLPRGRLVAPPARCSDWLVVWNDYPEAAHVLAEGHPLQVLRSGPMSATLLRCP